MSEKNNQIAISEIEKISKKNETLEKEINLLKEKNNELTQKLNQIIRENNIQEQTLASYRKEFQTIFFDHKLESKGVLKNFQEIGVEMLKFIDNVCKKYNINYWLNCGTLIGAVRHKGYVPWDDDLDLGMIRKDFNKFMEVFDNEIKRFDLENNFKWSIDIIVSEIWVQSFIKIYYFDSKGHALGGLDIFPYDFIIEKTDETESLYYEEEYNFHKKIMDGKGRKQAEKDYYKKLGMSYEIGEYVIQGVDGGTGNGPGEAKYHFHKYDDVFPLNEIEFCNTYFKCPNKPYDYLKSIYGEIYHLPRIIIAHDVIEKMHKIPGLNEEFLKETRRLNQINKKF